MNKHLLTILTAVAAATMPAAALLEGDGYYRVQNAKTGRYVYVLDDKGRLNFQATTADLGALELWSGFDRAVSDPSTVIFVTDLTGKSQDYDMQTQGTGVHAILNYPVSIYFNKSTANYSVFGRNSGLTKYIGDATKSTAARGHVTSLENGEYYRWHFHPMTTGDDSNYFGVTGEYTEDGNHWSTLYAGFPFAAWSPGMTFYTVGAVADGKVYLKELAGTVAQGTPVIVRAQSASPSDCRLSIGGTAAAPAGNMLRGVYFNNNDLVHKNLTPYDKSTMRVLGTCSDGSIGFVTADLTYLPRNKAYLSVPAGTPAELHLTTEAIPAGISDAEIGLAKVSVCGRQLTVSGATGTVEVYNITGSRVAVRQGVSDFTLTLPSAGLYLVKSATTVTKVLAK